MTKVIELDRLLFSWSRREHPILEIPSLTVEKGESLFVGGESGSGKSTLLNLIAGIYQPTGGDVRLLGQSLARMNASGRDRFRSNHLGVIFQEFNLLPFLSVRENILLPIRFIQKEKLKKLDVPKKLRELTDNLGLDSLLNRGASLLSVGQAQRVAIARALIAEPEIVIADEPTSALDQKNASIFLELLFGEIKKHDTTLVFVSHDWSIASRFSQTMDLRNYCVKESHG